MVPQVVETRRQPTAAEAMALLVEKIKHPALSHEALSRRLRKQKVLVEAQDDPERIPAKLKPIIAMPDFPQKLVSMTARAAA